MYVLTLYMFSPQPSTLFSLTPNLFFFELDTPLFRYSILPVPLSATHSGHRRVYSLFDTAESRTCPIAFSVYLFVCSLAHSFHLPHYSTSLFLSRALSPVFLFFSTISCLGSTIEKAVCLCVRLSFFLSLLRFVWCDHSLF